VLKADFRKCHRWPQYRLPLGCEPNPPLPFPVRLSYRSSVKITRTLWWQTWFTRGCVREWKSGHNSVTVQNRTHVYMNFFDHNDLGNHLLQLCTAQTTWKTLHCLIVAQQFLCCCICICCHIVFAMSFPSKDHIFSCHYFGFGHHVTIFPSLGFSSWSHSHQAAHYFFFPHLNVLWTRSFPT
jgi:hypothetical protein